MWEETGIAGWNPCVGGGDHNMRITTACESEQGQTKWIVSCKPCEKLVETEIILCRKGTILCRKYFVPCKKCISSCQKHSDLCKKCFILCEKWIVWEACNKHRTGVVVSFRVCSKWQVQVLYKIIIIYCVEISKLWFFLKR